jgi:hypothetical protein
MARFGWTVKLMFWIGIVVDAVAAVALLSPADSPIRQLAYPGVLGSQIAYSDGTRTAFPLMLGWTLLLVWGVRRSIERRMILLLTLPVLVGFMVVEILDVNVGHASVGGTLVTLLIQCAVAGGILVAYLAAGRSEPLA